LDEVYSLEQATVKGTRMDQNVFDIFMVVALGSSAGTLMGVFIGYAAKKQKNEWSRMSRKDQITNGSLIFFFSLLFCAGFAFYSLL
jgi:membrane protein YqaA with SNARE-associated domain